MAASSCDFPLESAYEIAMPVAFLFGKKQGAGPKVTTILNTFLPEGLGVSEPLTLHPAAEVVENVPVLEMVAVIVSPLRVEAVHVPDTAVKDAGVSYW